MNADDYDKISVGDKLVLPKIKEELRAGTDITLVNETKNEEYKLICDVSERQIDILAAGGLLDYTKEENK